MTLSRPFSALAAINAPSANPGLSIESERHLSAISAEDSANFLMSNPAAAAGTIPNALNAENRPPTSSGVDTHVPNSPARALSDSGVPGSDRAMKFRLLPEYLVSGFRKERKCDSSDKVSIVEPDLLDTKNRVLFGSSFSLISLMLEGITVSRTWDLTFGNSFSRGSLKSSFNASDVMLLPPIPRRTISENPSAKIWLFRFLK